ncbi:acetylgalactosaminyl-O-glycosyl-glycoprotein beta-1,3-N-acetylglucosaminyltransferase [Cephus cinctus]|uniref:Hexosyltransferase n=1 Tax=Cephus cinctus TaxID=211228 RepID=A0AAJ7W1Z0_CEPCN|nr:acetylgalactosaminyl-O-glycosyl-glycoprotein beta-1,3-N-acetylglucosaminyltransferase [Cephus cinctus]XP_015596837.1 acetylgalactosaminyl-O-glycosyl-glycoprotein beta-1,3-N-acetylglucosaminyltransferase [Cephus cinctus]XP_015596839.1 acetylgalactosaminyl-O-glycosyl-glycoprotein beta-1,3-N-acetylglucosaminyltransferase [Cephus cinctus]XP_024941568.1 acetylgalactosaminyl-O-glycosyl-glycoprotein beta-1,3-N-acetylglucosaminyltransferase [Cephus cinctus]XP_024941569.1 acetylgalactosaminyl-O-glyco
MLDKRRLHAPGSPPCSLLFVVALTITGCFSFWLLNGCPGPPVPISASAPASGYLLILPQNASALPHPYSMSELPPDDESTLIDMKNFRFTLNHNPCNGSQSLLLLVLVHSAPGNFLKRKVVRDTWGKRTPAATLLFLVGLSEQHQAHLEEEDRVYGDLIQGNFLDAYRNMTYKHVMALKWATYHCQSAKYVLKLDDDVFVHMPAMLDFLIHEFSPWGARRLILCDPLPSAVVKRSWRSKWRVSPLEYPGRHYPAYCAGWAILYSPDTVFLLYREAQKEPYFWIDDVHITGTLARKVNLTQASLHSLVLTAETMEEVLQNPKSRREFLFGPPDLTEDAIRALYSLITTSLA